MKTYVVFGCGRFGSTVASTLYELGNDVLAIDYDQERVQAISENVTTSVQCDVLDERAITELGLTNFDVAIIAIGENLEAAIMAVLISKEAGIKKIVAKALTPRKGDILSKIGADSVVYPERDMGFRLAYNLMNRNIMDYIQFSDDYSIAEVRASKKWIGKSISSLDFRKNYGVTIIAIQKEDDKMIIDPNPTDIIEKTDFIIIIGKDEAIKEIEKLK